MKKILLTLTFVFSFIASISYAQEEKTPLPAVIITPQPTSQPSTAPTTQPVITVNFQEVSNAVINEYNQVANENTVINIRKAMDISLQRLKLKFGNKILAFTTRISHVNYKDGILYVQTYFPTCDGKDYYYPNFYVTGIDPSRGNYYRAGDRLVILCNFSFSSYNIEKNKEIGNEYVHIMSKSFKTKDSPNTSIAYYMIMSNIVVSHNGIAFDQVIFK